MIAVDTNILVYAHRPDSPFFSRARGVVQGLAEGDAPWAIPWACVSEFLATVTSPRLYQPPTPTAVAIDQLDKWFASPWLTLLAEGDGYFAELRALAVESNAVGGRVHDARIAALCLYHGVSELWTADRDFGRFPRLRIRNPLVA